MLKLIIFLFFVENIVALNFTWTFLSDFSFVQNFTDIFDTNYQLINNNNKNGIESMENILFNIQTLFNNNTKNKNEKKFWEYIKKLEEHKYKKSDYFQSGDLMLSLFLIQFEEERINTNVKLLMDIFRYDIYFIDLEDFCVHATNITREFINKNYYMEKIVDEYNKLLLGVGVQMMKEEWNNFCGQTMAARFGINDYFKSVMQSYLKIFGVFYYSWVINGHCTGADPRQILSTSKSKFLDNFKKTITSTKHTIHDMKHYMYLCPERLNRPRRRSVTGVSLREQLSDFTNNWIVVGVRFVEDGHIVHIQILEGLVSAYGKISMTRWQKVDENVDVGKLKAGRDYVYAKKVNLGDVLAPLEYVITGVRFRFTSDPLTCPMRTYGIIQLEIHATKLNFLRGKLEVKNSRWISTSLNSKGEISLKDITSEKTRELQTSELNIDAGQAPIPFFDGRNLEFSPPAPLQGLGLFHHGDKNNDIGGYLTFHAFDFDISTIFYGL